MSQPLAKFRAGAASSAVWSNEAEANGRKVTMLKATVERRYKDAAGAWRSSGSFSRNELPLAIHCLQKAFEWILDKQAEQEPAVEEEVVA